MLRLMAYSTSRPHDEDFLMQAHEFMTKEPVTVSPETPTPEIARLLLAHKISAAPVVADAAGRRRSAASGLPCHPAEPAAYRSRSHVRTGDPDYRNNRGTGNSPPP